jgi:hypothetical protein
MKNISISFTSIRRVFVSFLRRFHIVLFVTIVFGCLAIAVLMLYTTILASGDPKDYTPNTTNTSFDEETLKRVEELKTRDETASEPAFPSGRINPFIE